MAKERSDKHLEKIQIITWINKKSPDFSKGPICNVFFHLFGIIVTLVKLTEIFFGKYIGII